MALADRGVPFRILGLVENGLQKHLQMMNLNSVWMVVFVG